MVSIATPSWLFIFSLYLNALCQQLLSTLPSTYIQNPVISNFLHLKRPGPGNVFSLLNYFIAFQMISLFPSWHPYSSTPIYSQNISLLILLNYKAGSVTPVCQTPCSPSPNNGLHGRMWSAPLLTHLWPHPQQSPSLPVAPHLHGPPGCSSEVPDMLSLPSKGPSNFFFLEYFCLRYLEGSLFSTFSLDFITIQRGSACPLEKSTPILLPSFIFHNSTYHPHMIFLIFCLYSDCLAWQWLCLFLHCWILSV